MQKVIDKQYTSVLFSLVFVYTEPRSVYTERRPSRSLHFPLSLFDLPFPPKLFRINTCKSLSKQTTLTVIESHSYRKQGGMEGVMVNQLQARRLRQLSLLAFFTLCTRFAANFALCFQKLPH